MASGGNEAKTNCSKIRGNWGIFEATVEKETEEINAWSQEGIIQRSYVQGLVLNGKGPLL